MGKQPAFQFYVKDWLSDPELQCVSASSRGLWIDALCYMWEAPERGKLIATVEEMAKLLRATNGDFSKFLDDLKRHKFADVTICNKELTLINRRMFREQKERENTRLRVSKFRSNAKSNANVTVSSSSSSPTPTPKIKKEYKERKIFSLDNFLESLKKNPAYSWIDLDNEINKMKAWFSTPKGKGRKLNSRFILNWLDKIEKPFPISQPFKSEIPNPEIIPKDFIPDPHGKEKIEAIIKSLSKEKEIPNDFDLEKKRLDLQKQAEQLGVK